MRSSSLAHSMRRSVTKRCGVHPVARLKPRANRKELIRTAPAPLKTVVVSLAPVALIDVTAVDALAQLHGSAVQHGRRLVLAAVRDPVRDTLARASLLSAIGEENVFRNMENAVEAVTGTVHHV